MGKTKEEAPKTYSLRVTEHALQNINSITGYINPTAGRRLGMGAGRGVARGGRCFGGIRPRGNSLAYQDSDSLKNYAKHLELELESAKKRLEEIEVAGKQ